MVTEGPTNSLTDVDGLRVGQHSRVGDGWLTGTTVVLAPPSGAVAAVDVRGGGPGTRETDALNPENLVERAHAIVLSGGSAYGLAAADGVMARLADAGIGFPVGGPGEVVPIVPAAVLFDLGRGGRFRATPDASFGAAAYDAASTTAHHPTTYDPTAADQPVDRPAPQPTDRTADDEPARQSIQQGSVGAGAGAVTGLGSPIGPVKGGIGTASAVLDSGETVAALVAVNAVGSAVDPRTGELYGARFGLPGEFDNLRAAQVGGLGGASSGKTVFNTTIGVVATDATLTKAQCRKMAGTGHDGIARAIHPAHLMVDGDTLFALATCARPAPDHLDALLAAAADAVTRAIVHAMLAATGTEGYPSYRERFGG
jgi:putative pantetheine hydrolase